MAELRDDTQSALLEPEHIRTGGVRTDEALAQHSAVRGQLEKILLEELLYARYTPVHERRRSTYGAIVFEGAPPENVDDFLIILPVTDDANVTSLRELANGISAFLVRTLDAILGIGLVTGAGSELALVTLTQELGCDIVQRHPSGAVRIFGRERLMIHEFDTWRRVPYGHTRWLAVSGSAAANSEIAGSTAWEVIDLALHVLSAQQVGATLILMLNGTTSSIASRLTSEARPLPIDLNVAHAQHSQLLATALAAVDGACLIESDGTVAGIGAMFGASVEAKTAINLKHHGARHHAAARLSFDEPSVLAFVVSADGAVSVFSDGRSILNLDPTRSEADAMVRLAGPEKAESIYDATTVLNCPSCHKRLLVTITIVEGWRDHETLDCPVCGKPDIYAKNCWHLSARVLKPWEGQYA